MNVQRNSNQSSTISNLDTQRRQEILQKLQQEREMRRKYVEEGRQEEFRLQSITSLTSEPEIQNTSSNLNPFYKNSQYDDLNTQEPYFRTGGDKIPTQSSARPETVSSGFQGHRTNSGFEDFDQNKADESQNDIKSTKSDLVQKLLNERKQTRSKQSQQQVPTTQQESSNSHQLNFQQTSSMIGGFNPESLYQEEVQHEIYQNQHQHQSQQQQILQGQNKNSMQQQIIESQLSQTSNSYSGTLNEDSKYRDAVAYAKSQIQKELMKQKQRSELISYDQSSGYPSEYQKSPEQYDQFMQDTDQPVYEHRQSVDEEQFTFQPPSAIPQQRYQAPNAYQQPPISKQYDSHTTYSNNNNSKGHIAQGLFTMEKSLAQQSNQKTIAEMNSRKEQKHKFQTENENQGFLTKIPRPSSANVEKRGEYLKNTISHDFKKGNQPTSNKTKQLMVEAERKQQEENTFQPKINEYAVPPSKELSKEERWKKLTEPKTSEIQKRDRIKLQQQMEEAQKTCTFKPETNKQSKSARKRESEGKTLEERLLHEADLRKEKREKLKRELDMEQMKDCSFKPQLKTSNSVVNVKKFSNQIPIHERVGTLQKEKNEKLQKLRIQNEMEQQDLTFKPKVNSRSEKMTIIKRQEEEQRPQDVVERLYQDASDRIQKQMKFSESYNDQLNKDHPFHPQISKQSNYMSEKSDMFNGNLKDFYDRQQAFVEKQMEKKEQIKNQHSEQSKCTFKPQINVTSEIIVESDPLRGNENEEERYMRLYKKDQKKQEVVKELIEKEIYSQYTFKPQINKISKTLAKDTQLDDLAYNKKGQEKKDKLKEECFYQETQECTFKPQTTQNKKYSNVAPTYDSKNDPEGKDFSEKLKKQLKDKQEKIAQERREREYQMMKDCTFKPQLMENQPSTQKDQIVVVRGLGRHLELQELRKKKEEDKKLREAEVFGLNHKFSVNANELDITNPNRSQVIGAVNITQQSQFTVQKPFELSSGINSEGKKAKLMKELKEKEMKEYTFKPSTNEGRNKQIIQEILEEAEKENEYDDLNIRRNFQQEQYYY